MGRMTPHDDARIVWHRTAETRHRDDPRSPDPDQFEPLGFPPPWPTRPWIYGNVIASREGIVTWSRSGTLDDPVRTIAGGDSTRPGRRADVRLLRYLRACADAVSFGAETLRDQPDLIGSADLGGDRGERLLQWRARHGLGPVPLQVIYSASGRLDLDVPIFTTPDLTVVVVTTATGARRLREGRGAAARLTALVAGEDRIDALAFRRAHERLHDEFGVRYLDCEGGVVALESLRAAGILDEVFVTVTDTEVDAAAHANVRRIFDFEAERAGLAGEGRVAADAGYVFRRWRFNGL
jgi:riboflavin biosynthesis pyrimidine reductase